VTSTADPAGQRWLLRPLPPDGSAALLCFPYSGVGASSYRGWPRVVGGMSMAALQPPGRENRAREPRPGSHHEFARSLLAALAGLGRRPFAFFGHCGAVPYMLETIFQLADDGGELPMWIIASSWGAPHRGLYGALNFVDLEQHDIAAEVVRAATGSGVTLLPEMVRIAADVLRHDLVVQRAYRYPAGRRIPVPVMAVGWAQDDVVVPEVAIDGWDEVAEVRAVVLPGAHGDYLRCPAALQELVASASDGWPAAGRSGDQPAPDLTEPG